MNRPRVLILGGGPAGLGAAYRLATAGRADVTLIEQRPELGGNAGSFEIAGQPVDYGSHRLHPACRPDILADLRRLLGDELLDRPRHGRIRLENRWIRFPLRPLDLLLRLPPRFALGAAWDARPWRSRQAEPPETFASVLARGLGPTICHGFYFPYARKIWGRPPEELSPVQARRRVSAGSPAGIFRKLFQAVPGFKRPGAGRFFYPRGGFGRISETLAEAACSAGAVIETGVAVTELRRAGRSVRGVLVRDEAGERRLTADHIFSTLPATLAVRLLTPEAPPEVRLAADALRFRAMLLIYLVLDRPQYTPWDAHYFPGADIRITRLSEPKNYRATDGPRTVLCAELPCEADDATWSASTRELGELVAADLERAGLPAVQPTEVVVRKLRFAYPLYDLGAEERFQTIDAWLGGLESFTSFGRQGLFAHDNTHHALAMAYAAADCLGEDGRFDRTTWAGHRQEFESHVVED